MESPSGEFGLFVEKFQTQTEQNLGWMKVGNPQKLETH